MEKGEAMKSWPRLSYSVQVTLSVRVTKNSKQNPRPQNIKAAKDTSTSVHTWIAVRRFHVLPGLVVRTSW